MMLRQVCVLLLPVCATLSSNWLRAQDVGKPFTVADSIEATQVLHDRENGPALVSPDEKRYLVVLQRGDVARNGSWVELLSGSLASVESAAKINVASRLFTKSKAQARDLVRNVRWLADSRHIVFMWDDGSEPARIVSVDVLTHRRQTLVRHPTPIMMYDVSRDGRTIVFIAQSPRDAFNNVKLEHSGFVVGTQSIWTILRGDFNGSASSGYYETFIYHRTEGRLCKIKEARIPWPIPPELLQVSPEGRFAVTVRPVEDVPRSWDAFTEHLFKDVYLPAARENPDSPNFIRQYFIIDLKEATIRPLWSAPEDPLGDAVWSPSGYQLAIGPTFLPVSQASPVGLAGRAVVVADIDTGRYEYLPLPESSGGSTYRPVRWSKDGIIEIAEANASPEDSANLDFERVNGEWRRLAKSPPARASRTVRVELREDSNTPPALYAVDDENESQRLIRDLNPHLRTQVSLGHVVPTHWKGTDGRSWTGMVYYPVHYEPGRSFPLVIQTHGYFLRQFSLDGSFTTVFAAQALANRDIMVLQIGGPDGGIEDIVATPKEADVFMAGCEGAIEFFVSAGLADSEKIGIIGFSRTGWLVEYMLTHSAFRLAAAEVADNIDASYLQYLLDGSDRRIFDEKENGGRPFGEGIQTWAHMAPGFNADQVHSPLRMELDTGPIDLILAAWEMFSNLRYLRKPVELFVIPDIQHGVHLLQNPEQRLASQGGTVDWFSFWLSDQEDPDPNKAAQYARWRELRKLQR